MEAHILTSVDRPQIIADALTITCDPADHCGRMSLLVRDGRIMDIATDAQVLRESYRDAEVIDAHTNLVIPAFVNAHYHPESLLFEDIARTQPYTLWKLDPIYQKRAERIADPSFIESLKTVYGVAAVHGVRSGTLTVGHIIPSLVLDELRPLMDHEKMLPLRTRTVLRTWEQIAHGKELKASGVHLAVSIGGEAEYTVYSLDNLARSARDLDVSICVHLAELREEAEIFRRNFKKGLLAVLRDARILSSSTQIAHLNHGTADDLRIIAEHHLVLTLCPRSAALKRTGYPLLRHLDQYRVPLCLGTDWGGWDMMDEMKFVSDLPYLFSNLPDFSSLDILKMATINGAEALGFGAETGSIERGKQADLVFFRLHPTHMEHVGEKANAEDLARLLLTRMRSPDIVRVMARGAVVYHDGKCLTIDEPAVVLQFRELFASMPGAFKGDEAELNRAKIIPFMTPGPQHAADDHGYEEGFPVPSSIMVPAIPTAVVAKPSDVTKAAPVAPKVQQEQKIRNPELSKDVKLSFGDDDVGTS